MLVHVEPRVHGPDQFTMALFEQFSRQASRLTTRGPAGLPAADGLLGTLSGVRCRTTPLAGCPFEQPVDPIPHGATEFVEYGAIAAKAFFVQKRGGDAKQVCGASRVAVFAAVSARQV